MTSEILVTKANGKKEIFEPEKLRASLVHAGAPEDAVEEVLTQVLPNLRDGMSTNDIYRYAFNVLHNKNKRVARSYSLRRAVMDLGPSGFPFEDFVAEVLRAKGFECLTRQVVLGGCVPHEVDVVAYDDKSLIMIEAKFHNELGNKSDLKVVLYIKARFDDLKENMFDYGGRNRKITDSWLITNTKFSSTAIHYGECKQLTMIGWNYPAENSLQKMIEEENLHPVTCLTSLTDNEKHQLLTARVVLCSTLKEEPDTLNKILGAQFDTAPVLAEVNELG